MRTRRIAALTTAALLVATASTALASPAAFAATRLPIATFGAPLAGPTGVAVDQANGNVYVASAAGTVGVFGAGGGMPADGAPSQISGIETPRGEFRFGGETAGVAVDDSGGSSNGAVYVDDLLDGAIDKFDLNASHEYEYICQFTGYGGLAGSACLKNEPALEATPAVSFDEPLGLATDSHGNLYVADYGSQAVYEFSSTGEEVASYESSSFGRPEGVAVGASGDIYVQSYSNHDLVELQRDPSGDVTSEVTLFSENVRGVALDRASGHVFVDFGEKVEELGSAHEVLDEFGAEDFHGSRGLAVDEAADRVYVSDPEHEGVDEYGGVVPQLGVVTGEPSNVRGTRAVLTGSVNPEGVATVSACEFEYGPTRSYGSTAPCSPMPSTGSSPVAVSAPIEGLSPGGTYHYRLVVTETKGVTTKSGDVTFTTRLPTGTAGAPTGVETTSATLNAVVEPSGVPIETCEFEYGQGGSYANSAPCSTPPGAAEGAVAEHMALTGLELGAAYQYRLTITFSGGEALHSADEVLVTPPQVEGAVLASNVSSFAATLTGSIEAGELTPEYHYAYGLTSNYGSVAPQPDAKAVPGGQQTVTQTLTGLQPGTTYHFALVATNFGGAETVGPDETFTTRPLAPPVIGTGIAEAIGQTGATLTGAVGPEGLATSYSFEYGTSAAYGSSWPTLAVSVGSGSATEAVAVEVTGLQPGVTYHYRLVANNEDGASYGADQTFTTQGYPVSSVLLTPTLGVQPGFVDPEAPHGKGKPAKQKRKKKAQKRRKARTKHKQGKR
jgi:hypothetical protein